MNIRIECMRIRVPAAMAPRARELAQQTAKNILHKMTHDNVAATPVLSDATLTISIPAGTTMQNTAAAAAGAIIRRIGMGGT